MAAPENLLRHETSPYLLQHADNPVHWRPWGAAALEEARDGNKPILLSIGYAACHWCHVMAHESFEDPDTAALMNERFVNIKVDREERPDIDHLYMSALHALGEQGGWPLTMFIAPDGAPFWGGTYFPPEPRWGRPSFRQVLQGVSEAYRTDHEMVTKNTTALRRGAGRACRSAESGRSADAGASGCGGGGAAAAERSGAWRAARRTEIPQPADIPLPVAERVPHRRAGGAGGAAPDAATHVAGRHLRPSGRRLFPLLHRCDLAGAAFREDAVRQRPVAGTAGAGARASARPAVCGSGRRRLSAGWCAT